MDFGELNPNQTRLIGDYILGPKIGSGSFAVVWKSRHRQSGTVVAVKEIDKKHLVPKVSDNLLKEISILSTINHPNITRLFEAIQTSDKIYLVLEYCEGGDLADYINRHGKVSEAVAKHFMRQLAAGLKILQEKHLIHRDLKPQNLLLSSKEVTPLLKIGDFGFARSLTPQGLADTLCGSPLYMAPEIIQNQKYDAKADLWSVGAILYQLLTGKHPFDGNNPLQLFQNILKSTELRFPKATLEELNSDCLDLCRSLLRQNPVERITFKEFFNHKFLEEPRPNISVEAASVHQTIESVGSESEKNKPSMEQPVEPSSSGAELTIESVGSESEKNKPSSSGAELTSLSAHDRISDVKNDSSPAESVHEPMLNIGLDELRKSLDRCQQSLNQIQVSDSMESIEKDYVLVNAHFPSVEMFSYHIETSLPGYSSRISHSCLSNQDMTLKTQKSELVGGSSIIGKRSRSEVLGPFSTSRETTMLREFEELPILHPSARLQLFRQYVQVLSELSLEKCNAGLFLESFSVELVMLALWQKAVEICHNWLASSAESESSGYSSERDSTPLRKDAALAANEEENIDFNRPSSVSEWAAQGFIAAFDHAEKLSQNIKEANGTTKMPDAMEIIYRKALSIGISGAVDEYMENKDSAAVSYSKAMLLFSFILGEAESLKLTPPFLLTCETKKRIRNLVLNLQTYRTNLLTSQPLQKLSQASLNN